VNPTDHEQPGAVLIAFFVKRTATHLTQKRTQIGVVDETEQISNNNNLRKIITIFSYTATRYGGQKKSL